MAGEKLAFFLLLFLFIIGTCKGARRKRSENSAPHDVPQKPITTLVYAAQNASQDHTQVTLGFITNTSSFQPISETARTILIQGPDLVLLSVPARKEFCVFLANISASFCAPPNPQYIPSIQPRSNPEFGQVMHFDPTNNGFTWFNATTSCIQLLKGRNELVLTVFCSPDLVPSQALIDYSDWLLFWLPKNGRGVLRTTLYSREDKKVLESFDYPLKPGDRIKFTIDPSRRRIYWLSGLYLKSAGYSGSDVRILRTFKRNKTQTQLVFDGSNKLYWIETSHNASSSILMHDLDAPSQSSSTVIVALDKSTIQAIALRLDNPPRTGPSSDPCSHGRCSHFCSPAPDQARGYICWCPEELIILRNNHTCHKASLLVTTTQSGGDPGLLRVFQADPLTGSKDALEFPPMNLSNSAFVITGNDTTWRFCWVATDRSIRCKTNLNDQVITIRNSSISPDAPLIFINPQGTDLYWSDRRPGCFRMFSFPLNESLYFPCLSLGDLNSTAISLDYRRRSFFWSVNKDKIIMQRNINIPGERRYSSFSDPEACTGLAWDEDQFRLFILTKNQVFQAVQSQNFYHGKFVSLIKLPYDHARHLQHHRNVLFWVGGNQFDGQFIDALRLNPTQASGKPLDHIRAFTNPSRESRIVSFQAYELFNFVKTWTVPCDTANCSHFCTLDDEFPRANILAHQKFACRCPEHLMLNGSICVPIPVVEFKRDSYLAIYVSISVALSLVGVIAVISAFVIRYRKQRFIISLQLTIAELLEGNQDEASAATETSEKVRHLPFTSVINKEFLSVSTDKILGEGNFGIVYQGVYESQAVAVKTLKHGQNLQMLADFVRELKTLQYVGNHEHIVRFFGGEVSQVQEGQILVVLELSPYGSLLSYILSQRKMHTSRGDLQFASRLPPQNYSSSSMARQVGNRYDSAPGNTQTLNSHDMGMPGGNTYTGAPSHGTGTLIPSQVNYLPATGRRSRNTSGDVEIELSTVRHVETSNTPNNALPLVPIPAPRSKVPEPEFMYSNLSEVKQANGRDSEVGCSLDIPNECSESSGLPEIRFRGGIDPEILQAIEFDNADAETGNAKPAFSLDLLMDWGEQIARGMAYLVEKNIVHGDLAARNILVFEGGIVKISDFGFAQNTYQLQSTKTKKIKKALPWRWAAIETLTRMEMSAKSDVWSFGVTLWEIFTLGKIPFPQHDWSPEFIVNLRNGMRLEKPDNVSQDMFKDIFFPCWALDPDKRPAFQHLADQLVKFRSDLITNSIK